MNKTRAGVAVLNFPYPGQLSVSPQESGGHVARKIFRANDSFNAGCILHMILRVLALTEFAVGTLADYFGEQ